jgi:hypothetical protein
MPYTATKLITNAYYTSGIVGREFQTVSGAQLNDGLDILNELLTDKFAETDLLPYYTTYDFNVVQGQESYFIPNLVEIDTLVFFINSVRYAMRKTQRDVYFGSPRADNIQSLPFNWHFERGLGGGTIYLYFLPDVNYPMQLVGQFGLLEATINQDLLLTFDQFYISYLKYDLARRLCINYDYVIPDGVSLQLLQYELSISKRISPMDLSMQKISTLGKRQALNYAQVNLGGGWTVA